MPLTYRSGEKYNLTIKQRQIMTVIINGDGKDENGEFIPVDMNMLLDRLVYKTTKQSMQFSLRALIAKGMIVKGYCHRRHAKRVVYFPTRIGRQSLGFQDAPLIESNEDLSYLDI